MSKITNPTPVLVLGGQENTLAIVRSLSRRGIPVSVSAEAGCYALRSRYCANRYPIPDSQEPSTFWHELLLDGKHPGLRNCVLFACSDDAVDFMAHNRSELEKLYLIDDFKPELHLAMLDKQKTLELARSVDVPTPNFWNIDTIDDVISIENDVMFPVMIKPIHSHLFQRQYDRKLFIIHDFDDLLEKSRDVVKHELEFMICEMIPGPDDLLCSYFTYMDRKGNHLYHFTKRILRRYPLNRGGGSYHITEWIPETAELGQKFFDGLEYRGLGNIEFKRDTRDGKLKVIEVNARFTAVQKLLYRCGMDIAFLLYANLTGREAPKPVHYRQFMRMWYPIRDLLAYRELKALGRLNLAQWLKSIAHRQVLPFFEFRDPLPSLAFHYDILSRKLASAFRVRRRPNG